MSDTTGTDPSAQAAEAEADAEQAEQEGSGDEALTDTEGSAGSAGDDGAVAASAGEEVVDTSGADAAAETVASDLDENEQMMADDVDMPELEKNPSPFADAAATMNDPTGPGGDLQGPTIGTISQEGPGFGQGMISDRLDDEAARRYGLEPGGDWQYIDGNQMYFGPNSTTTYDYDEWVVRTETSSGVTTRPMTPNEVKQFGSSNPPLAPIVTDPPPEPSPEPSPDPDPGADGWDAAEVTEAVEGAAAGLEEATGIDWTGDGTVAGEEPAPPPPSAEEPLPEGESDTPTPNPYAGQTHPQGTDNDPLTPDPATVNPSPEATGGGTESDLAPQPGVSDPPEGEEPVGDPDEIVDGIPAGPGADVVNPSPESTTGPQEMGEYLDPTQSQGTLDPSILDNGDEADGPGFG
ncbi:MAG TPA: hypothetical protein VD926_11855, partial [Acidimicrobiales bacterium]|nr:hypothetical protein [Acidimicrobiales bacterium]